MPWWRSMESSKTCPEPSWPITVPMSMAAPPRRGWRGLYHGLRVVSTSATPLGPPPPGPPISELTPWIPRVRYAAWLSPPGDRARGPQAQPAARARSAGNHGMAEVLENRIGRYEVLGELGRGAMGIVYKARDPQLDRVVAIKTIRLDAGQAPEHQEDLRRRFYREAMAAARLNHPHIVGVYDVIENEGVPCIVMEYVEGQTLGRLLEAEAPLQPARAIDLVVQVCQALDYAHGRGIVHRDIK